MKAHTGNPVVLHFICTGIEAVFLLEVHETETRFLALMEENTLSGGFFNNLLPACSITL